MKRCLMSYLPLEILTNILLRLSIESIATCKCVCKPWLDLIESADFLKSHLSESAPALAVTLHNYSSNWLNVFKMEDKHDPITKFDFPKDLIIHGSANGLLFLKNWNSHHFCLCNPITREFAEFRGSLARRRDGRDSFGFGMSKVSGQYKVVYHYPESGFHVYTIEAGSSWRRVKAATPFFDRSYNTIGALCSGNLHWLVSSKLATPYVCCFDLETEQFNTFSTPIASCSITTLKLYTLGDCLCFSDIERDNNSIWLLKGYEQADKCWIKVQLNMKEPYYSLPVIMKGEEAYKCSKPIKVYKLGDIFILWDRNIGYHVNSILFTPSFLSLKRNFGLKNVLLY